MNPAAGCVNKWTERRKSSVFMSCPWSPTASGPQLNGIPALDSTANLHRIISWLAGGYAVLTNSRHGPYWATPLREKVLSLTGCTSAAFGKD